MIQFFQQNLGSYILGLMVILLVYSGVAIWAPEYASTFAVITLLGIVLYHIKGK